jgi:3-deoxy-D-manno-octulosonate 8-phosphate phosphatase (KDO 8-P phosphatase)
MHRPSSPAPRAPRRGLRRRLARVSLLALDVDGTLTDGTILLSSTGDEIKGFSSRDGIGLKLWRLAGLHAAFVTARSSKAVLRRAKELGVRDVVLGSSDKGEALARLARRRGVDLSRTAFVGDDLQDLSALALAGVSIAVADAPTEVRARVDFVTRARGGAGAVREAVELLLKAQRRFQPALSHFLATSAKPRDGRPARADP